MNYLAHAFLGSNSDDERIGQLLADDIKGKQYSTYPEGIQRGILMHRWVDATTDKSQHLDEVKNALYTTTGRVTPIALDVIMDHFLCKHWASYHPDPLPEFIRSTYALLEKNREWWPAKSIFRLEKMIEHDWLSRYTTTEGIELTLRQMAQRKNVLAPLPKAIHVVEKQSIAFEKAFHRLIQELIVGYKSKINTFATLPPVC